MNGSQTLHSIKEVNNPNKKSRVMVRIIEVPPESKGDLSSQIAKRKEIIHKISLRTNMQNPIKRWNLVSNDDFNNAISQYFWQKGLYYERRQNEWKTRRTQFNIERIRKGPNLTTMIKIIAAFFYDDKNLGPANAQGRLISLFDESAYKKIREISPSHAYQLYLVYQIFNKHLTNLKNLKKNKHIKALQNYPVMILFSIICKSLKSHNYKFNVIENERKLETLLENNSNEFDAILLKTIEYILKDHERNQKRIKKTEGKELPYSTYFKNATYVNNIINKIPKNILSKIIRFF